MWGLRECCRSSCMIHFPPVNVLFLQYFASRANTVQVHLLNVTLGIQAVSRPIGDPVQWITIAFSYRLGFRHGF